MARKNRSIAGFDQVAGDNNNTNNNINTSNNDNNNININDNTDDNNTNDTLDQLLSIEEKEKRVLKGIYLDKDIAEVLDSIGRGQGRKGLKSEIVNTVLREKFVEKGYL